jgi:hypothetical protein
MRETRRTRPKPAARLLRSILPLQLSSRQVGLLRGRPGAQPGMQLPGSEARARAAGLQLHNALDAAQRLFRLAARPQLRSLHACMEATMPWGPLQHACMDATIATVSSAACLHA